MNTVNPRVRELGSPDQTVLIETNMLTSNIATSRHSTSEIPESMNSNPIEDINLAGIRISENHIPHGVYNVSHNIVESPTASEMNFSINDNNKD
ncbi:hypothetical protein RHMOL_Rhmol04G0201200 [Rhododendron molle]|uniref:Uncharacterized protein n=1 Tax=Rhododendron molle TaxID=49168 RepID=A0ACC0P4N0_RHOML|nr:hypothetical protein RHMOL_Rhmol04G0201200 [Rhododendron molle]